jgi:hypothetical protein
MAFLVLEKCFKFGNYILKVYPLRIFQNFGSFNWLAGINIAPSRGLITIATEVKHFSLHHVYRYYSLSNSTKRKEIFGRFIAFLIITRKVGQKEAFFLQHYLFENCPKITILIQHGFNLFNTTLFNDCRYIQISH